MCDYLLCEVNPDDVMPGSNLCHSCPLSYGPSGAEKCHLLFHEKRINGMYGVKCPTAETRCARDRSVKPAAPPECPLRHGQVVIKAGPYLAVPEVIVKANRQRPQGRKGAER